MNDDYVIVNSDAVDTVQDSDPCNELMKIIDTAHHDLTVSDVNVHHITSSTH